MRRFAPHPFRLLLLLSLVLASCCACRQNAGGDQSSARTPGTQVQILRSEGEPVEVAAEVVATASTRQKGLMFRSELAPGEGMLFVFPEQAEHPFWMKNTLIPLDILFIDADKTIVGIVHRARPRDETSLSVGVASKYVLEVPGGFCAEHGIHRGNRVDFDL